MSWCPKCKNEYVEGITTCAECGVELVDELPEGNLSDYRYQDGEFVYDPLPEPDPVPEEPSQLDRVEAQATYTAMMTDTLLESEV